MKKPKSGGSKLPPRIRMEPDDWWEKVQLYGRNQSIRWEEVGDPYE